MGAVMPGKRMLRASLRQRLIVAAVAMLGSTGQHRV